MVISMIYYEYWDKNTREWCLGKMYLHKYLLMKLIIWYYGKNNFSITDVKRVPKSKIKFY